MSCFSLLVWKNSLWMTSQMMMMTLWRRNHHLEVYLTLLLSWHSDEKPNCVCVNIFASAVYSACEAQYSGIPETTEETTLSVWLSLCQWWGRRQYCCEEHMEDTPLKAPTEDKGQKCAVWWSWDFSNRASLLSLFSPWTNDDIADHSQTQAFSAVKNRWFAQLWGRVCILTGKTEKEKQVLHDHILSTEHTG